MNNIHSDQEKRSTRSLFRLVIWSFAVILGTSVASSQQINPGITDPTNTYAGQTYNQWQASFWQYFMSLPSTNTPFYRSPLYQDAPLSTGQIGPVWFMTGNFLPGGTDTYSYHDTIPGGVALFTGMTTCWGDNTGCPPTSYSEQDLRSMAQSCEDGAANMSLTIDGVPVLGLSSVQNCPYRVQSILFNYSCPAVHNMLYDVFGETCYQTNTGMPYTIQGAVMDGVFLMIEPLSAGEHTITGTWGFPPDLMETWTRNLTVLPVTLKALPAGQPGSVHLSWPQTPDTYAVEQSPTPMPSAWLTITNLTISTTNRTNFATVPAGSSDQFFRLRIMP